MFKVSIRTIVLTVFILLLAAIGTSIISTTYSAGYGVIREATAALLRKTIRIIEADFLDTIQPVQQRAVLATELIKNRMIKVDGNPQFPNFLLQIITDLPNISAITYVTADGNYYELAQADNDNYSSAQLKCNPKICTLLQKQLDKQGRQLAVPTITSGAPGLTDSLIHSWYLKSQQARTQVITTILPTSINVAYPIYQASGSLSGVLSLKVNRPSLFKFLAKQFVTPSSFIYIFDDHDNVIATNTSPNFSAKTLPKVSEIQLPWVMASLQEFRQTTMPLFYFKSAGIEYLAFYDHFLVLPHHHWFIGIVLPFSESLATMNKMLLNGITITISILLFGLIIAWLLAAAIAKPIVKIANNAQAIAKLDLSEVSYKSSLIKEIHYLQNTFQSMRHSLKSFVRYLPFSIVKKLVVSGEVAHVGGKKRTLTFLFVDIANFTSLSEKMSPEALLTYLSEFFESMSRIIIATHGTVDKYIGDAIMAFWGAPIIDHKHAVHACECALAMHAALKQLNQKWRKQNKPQIQFRIGINTGEAIVGNVGSEDHLSYSAIGDAVNIANRIEEINKVYRTEILISHTVHQLIKNQFVSRMIDYVVVRGKEEAIGIYELLPNDNFFQEKLVAYNIAFQAAYACYLNQEWTKAIELFQNLKHTYAFDKLAEIFLERCKTLQINSPKNWDGVWRI